MPLVDLGQAWSAAKAAESLPAQATEEPRVVVWTEGGYKLHLFMVGAGETPALDLPHAEITWDTYIPLSKYPKVILLFPFALIGDVVT